MFIVAIDSTQSFCVGMLVQIDLSTENQLASSNHIVKRGDFPPAVHFQEGELLSITTEDIINDILKDIGGGFLDLNTSLLSLHQTKMVDSEGLCIAGFHLAFPCRWCLGRCGVRVRLGL